MISYMQHVCHNCHLEPVTAVYSPAILIVGILGYFLCSGGLCGSCAMRHDLCILVLGATSCLIWRGFLEELLAGC